MKYKPSRDIPKFARELKTLSPSKIRDHVLRKRNKEITSESVTMWFKRHPDVYEQLSKEIIEGLPTEKQAVSKAIFEKHAFEELPSVKDWILYMRTRRVKGKPLHPNYLKQQIGLLRRGLETHSVLKHPDRLTFRDAQEIFMELEEKGKDTYGYRRAFKDFLKSKGAERWEQIGVGKPRGFGTMKHLFVDRDTVHNVLDYVKRKDIEVYVADNLMWHNGIRIGAVLGAKVEDFKVQNGWSTITVLEKFREHKTFRLIPEVTDLLKQIIGDRTKGKIFDLTERRVNRLNREAIEHFAPDIDLKMPSHFFRHMFFQHLLRMLDWNYDKASAIGQTTAQSLKESYGGVPSGDVQAWEKEYLPKLDPESEMKEEEEGY